MLNSYIFVIRKQNATRNCNVLYEFLHFGFLDPPNVDFTVDALLQHSFHQIYLCVISQIFKEIALDSPSLAESGFCKYIQVFSRPSIRNASVRVSDPKYGSAYVEEGGGSVPNAGRG